MFKPVTTFLEYISQLLIGKDIGALFGQHSTLRLKLLTHLVKWIVFFSCGANSHIKNMLDRTPYDLALQQKDESVLEAFAIHLGQQELEKFTMGQKDDFVSSTDETWCARAQLV